MTDAQLREACEKIDRIKKEVDLRNAQLSEACEKALETAWSLVHASGPEGIGLDEDEFTTENAKDATVLLEDLMIQHFEAPTRVWTVTETDLCGRSMADETASWVVFASLSKGAAMNHARTLAKESGLELVRNAEDVWWDTDEGSYFVHVESTRLS